MKQRPILFQGAMVRALLDGSKTQTRRVVKKPNPDMYFPRDMQGQMAMHCPYGQPGDRLWVRETWAYHVMAMGSVRDELGPWVYAADGSVAQQARLCDRWRPSIHMHRAASRITLEVTGVRVERLQDISEADSIAEGIEQHPKGLWLPCAEKGKAHVSPQRAYRDLWQSINGSGSWDANPSQTQNWRGFLHRRANDVRMATFNRPEFEPLSAD